MTSTQLLLSAVVITKNEEKNIERCLQSLSFCDEIIVIDDNSTDRTVQLARGAKAKVYIHSLNKNFAQQRNFGLQKTHGKWVLFVDADEVVTKELSNEILFQIVTNEKHSAYFIRRVDVLWNKPMFFGELATFGSFGKGHILRLAKRDVGTWSRNIHETWNTKANVSYLKSPLLHFPHQTYAEFLSDIGERAKIHADMLRKEGKKSSLIKILVWPLGKFFYNFVYRLGFLDGNRGFVLAVTMSFHSFLSWTYIWLKHKA